SVTPSTTAATAAAASSSAASGLSASPNFKVIGIGLAIVSGLLIGSSFVFKKRGLLRSQAGHVAGEGVAYLASPLWWIGMTMMILGEICNFVAYAFVQAIVVTPLGALSVVISAMLSSIFLKETLTFFGWLGCGLCILGSVIIALNGPQEDSISKILEFQKLFISLRFLSYIGLLIAASIVIIVYFAPRYGAKSMIWYILVCSMIGGISVSVTTGLGSAIVETLYNHDNQFNKTWFIYFLIVFVIATLLTEIFYLNKALALFNTAMVTPTYYVIFTFFSMMTTIVLYNGLKAPASQIITLVMGFLVICFGITILQMSKVDPEELAAKGKLDRRSTLLLHAARVHAVGDAGDEKSLAGGDDPGIDALRGSFGTVGSIIRARSARRLSQASAQQARLAGASSFRATGAGLPLHPRDAVVSARDSTLGASPRDAILGAGLERHQLFDPPVPRRDSDAYSLGSARKQTIKFGEQDLVHEYPRGAQRDGAVHSARPSALTHGPSAGVGSPRSGRASLGSGPGPGVPSTPLSQ
ncbi:magnesium transporter NIPA-domain-containing protein, partial [Vararia minispora EC-137]